MDSKPLLGFNAVFMLFPKQQQGNRAAMKKRLGAGEERAE